MRGGCPFFDARARLAGGAVRAQRNGRSRLSASRRSTADVLPFSRRLRRRLTVVKQTPSCHGPAAPFSYRCRSRRVRVTASSGGPRFPALASVPHTAPASRPLGCSNRGGTPRATNSHENVAVDAQMKCCWESTSLSR